MANIKEETRKLKQVNLAIESVVADKKQEVLRPTGELSEVIAQSCNKVKALIP